MQTLGYVINGDKKIKLLVRQGKFGRKLMIRKSGRDGSHLLDEEMYLKENENKHLILLLQAGFGIYV